MNPPNRVHAQSKVRTRPKQNAAVKINQELNPDVYITAAQAKREGRMGLYASIELAPHEDGWAMLFNYKVQVAGESWAVLRRAYVPGGKTNTPRLFGTVDVALRTVREVIGQDKQVSLKIDWTNGEPGVSGSQAPDPSASN